jgi:hypothetical protein
MRSATRKFQIGNAHAIILLDKSPPRNEEMTHKSWALRFLSDYRKCHFKNRNCRIARLHARLAWGDGLLP